MAFDFLVNTLKQREAESLRRIRYPVTSNKDGIIEINSKHYLHFASNDYLGLSQHEQVLQSYVEGLAMFGSGSGASSVVTGYSSEHKALEEELCEALNKPAAMLFSSGFAANQAICQALFPHGIIPNGSASIASAPQIIADKYMHASFIHGALETGANFSRFAHNNMSHAQTLIARCDASSLVATEGVFSMDGDMGNIPHLQKIIQNASPNKETRPWLYIDDAHGFGVLGEHGFGTLDCAEVDGSAVDIVMGTFGKALGTSGAFVAGSQAFIEYMVNMSKHYVYSTAISAAQVRATRASLALVEQGEQREVLFENIDFFIQGAKQKGITLLGANTAIQPVIIGDPKRALKCARQLADLGLWVPAIRTPTVPKNTDRLRITLSAVHTKHDISALLDGLAMVIDNLNDISVNDGGG